MPVLLVTADARHGPTRTRSRWRRAMRVIASLLRAGAGFEVPQAGDAWHVLFSAASVDHSAARLAGPGVRVETGTHHPTASAPLGPLRLLDDRFPVGDPHGSLYAGRLLEWRVRVDFFAWRNQQGGRSWVSSAIPSPSTSARAARSRCACPSPGDGGRG